MNKVVFNVKYYDYRSHLYLYHSFSIVIKYSNTCTSFIINSEQVKNLPSVMDKEIAQANYREESVQALELVKSLVEKS